MGECKNVSKLIEAEFFKKSKLLMLKLMLKGLIMVCASIFIILVTLKQGPLIFIAIPIASCILGLHYLFSAFMIFYSKMMGNYDFINAVILGKSNDDKSDHYLIYAGDLKDADDDPKIIKLYVDQCTFEKIFAYDVVTIGKIWIKSIPIFNI